MTNIINISDFRNKISDYINRIIYYNDSFFLRKGNKIVAKVVSYKENEKKNNKKITVFAGIWDNNDGEIIEKYAKKIKKRGKLFSS